MLTIPAALSEEAKLLMLGELPLSPPQRRAFDRAWALAPETETPEALHRGTFPADHGGSADARKAFGMAEATEMAWIVTVVWAATRSLMVMCQKFADGQDLGPGIEELLVELQKVPGVDGGQAAQVAAKLREAAQRHGAPR
jgi:hypothetical protein